MIMGVNSTLSQNWSNTVNPGQTGLTWPGAALFVGLLSPPFSSHASTTCAPLHCLRLQIVQANITPLIGHCKIKFKQVEADHAVEVIPDAGHYVFIEQPQEFNKTLLRVLAPWLGGKGAGGDGAKSA